MAVANTLAYYDTATIMTLKSFIVQAPVKILQKIYVRIYADVGVISVNIPRIYFHIKVFYEKKMLYKICHSHRQGQTRILLAADKRTSLFSPQQRRQRKKLCSIDTCGQCYKTFSVRNLPIFEIS